MGIGEIKKVAVIGAGTMGPGIAQVFAVSGYDVHLCDISEKAIEKARSVIKGNLETLEENDVISPSVVESAQQRISFTTSLEDEVDPVSERARSEYHRVREKLSQALKGERNAV